MNGKSGLASVILLLKEKLAVLTSFLKKLFPTLQKQIAVGLFIFTMTVPVAHFLDFIYHPSSWDSNIYFYSCFPVLFFISIFFESRAWKFVHFALCMIAGSFAAIEGEPYIGLFIFSISISISFAYDLYRVHGILRHFIVFLYILFILILSGKGTYSVGFTKIFLWVAIMYTALIIQHLVEIEKSKKARRWDQEQLEKEREAKELAEKKLSEKEEDLKKVTDAADVLIQGRKRSSWHGTN